MDSINRGDAPSARRSEIVLIGPVSAGKTVVGELIAARLGIPHVDVDHVSEPYYDDAGWSVARFREIERTAGLLEAFRDGEEAMLSALSRTLSEHRGCVFSLGAAHSHFLDADRFARAASIMRSFRRVILLLPSPDVESSVRVLRDRCREGGLRPWRDDSADMIERWVSDPCNHDLATETIFTDGRSPAECAELILAGSI